MRAPIGDNIPSHLVTSFTILDHAKCHRTVMTGAAGFTLLHMDVMTERHLAYRVGLQVDFVFDPAAIANGRQGHQKSNRKYRQAPCHKLTAIRTFGHHCTGFSDPAEPFYVLPYRGGVHVKR